MKFLQTCPKGFTLIELVASAGALYGGRAAGATLRRIPITTASGVQK